MKIRRFPFALLAIAASVGEDLCAPLDPSWNGSSYGWATSPGTYAPRYNQRKARKAARRMGRAVVR